MPKTTAHANDYLDLIYRAQAIANFADNAGTSPATNLYVSLHTASPAVGGDQTTNECAYGSYARVAVARSAAGWDLASNVLSNAGVVTFPEATSGSETATHFGVGRDASGAGYLLGFGTLAQSLAIAPPVQPQFAAGELTVTET